MSGAVSGQATLRKQLRSGPASLLAARAEQPGVRRSRPSICAGQSPLARTRGRSGRSAHADDVVGGSRQRRQARSAATEAADTRAVRSSIRPPGQPKGPGEWSRHAANTAFVCNVAHFVAMSRCVTCVTDRHPSLLLGSNNCSTLAESLPWMEANGGPTAGARESALDGANRPLMWP
jgi:hypothetical protein